MLLQFQRKVMMQEKLVSSKIGNMKEQTVQKSSHFFHAHGELFDSFPVKANCILVRKVMMQQIKACA